MTEGEKENKWTEFKDKINNSIQSGIKNVQTFLINYLVDKNIYSIQNMI